LLIITRIFTIQKKKSMILQEMAQSVHSSLVSPLSMNDTVEHLVELAKYGQDWISIVVLETGVRVVRVDNNQALPSVLDAIQAARQ
jgi:hypothetical protein